MTREKWIKAIFRAFANECGEDFVGLWSISWKVRQLRPRLSDDDVRVATLEIARMLLDTHDIVAGYPTRDGRFVRWPEEPAEAIQRIEREWLALGRNPDIGDIVWFVQRDTVEIITKPDQTT